MRIQLASLALLYFFFTLDAVAADAPEKLMMDSYPDKASWREVTNTNNAEGWVREQIPANQQFETYQDILVAQGFPKLRNINPAIYFSKGMFPMVNVFCENIRVNGPKELEEGGYPVAYAQIYCGKDKRNGYGVNMLLKAIRGDDALYLIHREFRTRPTQVGGVMSFDNKQQAMEAFEAMSTANTYLLKSVYLCGKKSSDSRCISQ